jgi:hypothetical protein
VAAHARLARLMDLIDYINASERRDLGIETAHANAEDKTPGWTDRALAYVVRFLEGRGDRTFLTEDVRAFAESCGLAYPPDGRAWGAVTQKASRRGIIDKVGYAPAKSSNLSPKVLWRAA